MRYGAMMPAGALAFAIAASAPSGLVGTSIELAEEQHPDPEVETWRLYLRFDNDVDQLLTIKGDHRTWPLHFLSSHDLQQNCALPDSILCDRDQQLDLGGDSWVNIGEEHETAFSPGFLGGDGVRSVIHGRYWAQLDDGGYYDAIPTHKVLPDADRRILIAQFSISKETEYLWFAGTADYIPGGGDGFVSEPFSFSIGDPPLCSEKCLFSFSQGVAPRHVGLR